MNGNEHLYWNINNTDNLLLASFKSEEEMHKNLLSVKWTVMSIYTEF